MKQLAVTIPDDPANAMEKLVRSRHAYRKRSHLVADALEQLFKNRFPEQVNEKRKVKEQTTGRYASFMDEVHHFN